MQSLTTGQGVPSKALLGLADSDAICWTMGGRCHFVRREFDRQLQVLSHADLGKWLVKRNITRDRTPGPVSPSSACWPERAQRVQHNSGSCNGLQEGPQQPSILWSQIPNKAVVPYTSDVGFDGGVDCLQYWSFLCSISAGSGQVLMFPGSPGCP